MTTGTKAWIAFAAQMSNNTANAGSIAAVDISGATTSAAALDHSVIHRAFTVNQNTREGISYLVTGLTAGSNTFKLQYSVTAGTGSFLRRSLSVMPVGE